MRAPLLFRTRVNAAGRTVLLGRVPTKKNLSVLSFPVRLTVEHGGQYHRHITRIPRPIPEHRRSA